MAVHSAGALLGVETAAGPPAVYTPVGCVHDISGPEISVTSTESTCLADTIKDFIPGNADGGEVTFTLDYSETDYNRLHGYLQSLKNWVITFPDGGNILFTAFLTRLGLTIPYDDRIVVPVTLKLSELSDAVI